MQDILHILFKHKWKIILPSLIGIGAAVAVLFTVPAAYESQAKLLVRYVVDTSAIDQVDSKATASSSENILNSEVEILTSWDLAMQVAKALGPKRLLPESQGEGDLTSAASVVNSGLTVIAPRRTNIISVYYRNADPELATLALKELVNLYFTKHLEVHRSADAFTYVAQQSDQVLARLNQTEEQLKRLNSDLGITSLAESRALINVDLAGLQNALHAAEAERAEQEARVAEIQKSFDAQSKEAPATERPAVDRDLLQRYQVLLGQLDSLRNVQMELLVKYNEKAAQPELPDDVQRARQIRGQDQVGTDMRGQGLIPTGPTTRLGFMGAEREAALTLARERYRRQNDTGFGYQAGKKGFDALVKQAQDEILGRRLGTLELGKESQLELVRVNQMQIANLEQQLADLEKRNPELAAALPAGSPQRNQLNLQSERARLAGVEARVRMLKSRLGDLRKQSESLSEVAPRIERLERTKEIEEANYKYFQASLERARVDEALDSSKIPNISVVQSPSTAFRTSRDLKKIIIGLAGGGIAAGLAFAFLMEMLLDRSVKRPLELEALLGIPLLASIPYLSGRNRLRLPWPRATKSRTLALRNTAAAPWDSEHFIRSYSEAIRDRLVLYFELNGLNHKPKLVAVTDGSSGAGASTLAGGLAAALSETGDGKVLLVDMNVGRPEIQPFFHGAPACSLTEALVGTPAPAGDNLYLAVGTPADAPQASVIPKKFYDLMPHLKASDFDYIIFDMPPLGQTSITLPMARFMDKVILVAEAEKSNRDLLKRAYAELLACRASVSVIFNKARSYTPKWLGAET
ncbi:MAG TPA: Wzz/FepE/Etk N-terminal domain-containing protein [Terrimicrobiaceae bacterium]